MNEISIYTYKDVDISNSLVVIGFPTVGMVSTIVGNYLVTELELELVGAMASDEFFPAAVIHEGIPTPPIRIFAGKHVCGPKDRCDQIVVIASEFPIKQSMFAPLADTILDWVHQGDAGLLVTVEGLQMQDAPTEVPRVVFIANNDTARDCFREMDVEPMLNGAVGGVSGLLLFKATQLEDVEVGCLMAEAHAEYPDSRSAAAVLEVLDKMVPQIKMDAEPLLKQAEEIDEKIQQAMAQIPKGEGQIPQIAPSGMYR